MISEELKNSLKEILNLIPADEQHKEIYESDSTNNQELYDYIKKATKNRQDYFYVSTINKDLKNPLFLSSLGNLNIAYVDVKKRIVIKVKAIKEILYS